MEVSSDITPLSGTLSITQSPEQQFRLGCAFGTVSLLRAVVRVVDVSERVPALQSAACSTVSVEQRPWRERPDISSLRAAGRCSSAPVHRVAPGPSSPHAQDITRLLKTRGVITLIGHNINIKYSGTETLNTHTHYIYI